MAKSERVGREMANIRAAADARELDRRSETEEARRLSIEKMEKEAESCEKKCEEIFSKWTNVKELPADLRDALISQQKLCDQVLKDKDTLIDELQEELNARDYRFVKDLKRQAEDACRLSGWMEEQVSSRKKSMQNDLSQIEKSVGEERRALIDKYRKKWEQQMKETSENELKDMLQGLSVSEELEELRLKLKSRPQAANDTETEVLRLKEKVQELKVQLPQNTQRLENTLKRLRTRAKKNTILKAGLKRKIVRMQDVLANLKSRCIKQEKQLKADHQSLKRDYRRLCQQYKDMQKRARCFAARDAERYEKMWKLFEDEVAVLALRALENDRTIHEQVLGLPWTSPPLPTRHTRGSSAEESEAQENTGVSRRTAKRVLERLCDEAGFLEESKLMTLLAPLKKNEQSLIKLDDIISAIGIDSEMEESKMAEFLMKSRQHGRGPEKDHMGVSSQQGESQQESSDLIHPDNLLAALRDFTAQHCRPHDVQSPRSGDDSDDELFWESMASVVPDSKLQLYASLDTGLHKYHALLNRRAELVTETQALQQQNTKLKDLQAAIKNLRQPKTAARQISQMPDVDI